MYLSMSYYCGCGGKGYYTWMGNGERKGKETKGKETKGNKRKQKETKRKQKGNKQKEKKQKEMYHLPLRITLFDPSRSGPSLVS